MTVADVKMPVHVATPVRAETPPPVGRPEARALHDLFWSAHGVRVVRRGSERFDHEGVQAYLLIEQNQSVLFHPRHAARQFRGRGPAVVTLRVQESDGRPYAERVVADAAGRFVRVERRYGPLIRRETEVLVTRDPVIALLWRLSGSSDAGRRAVRLAAGPHGHRAAACPGGIFDAADPRDADRCAQTLMHRGRCDRHPWVHAASATIAPPQRRVLRRAFDLAFSAAALLFTAPLFPLIMLAIWLEDGRPFFFVHPRQTVGGRTFACLKFRTMTRDAESLRSALAERNLCDGPQFHIEDDPRLLRIGRLLRRLHLDELPQFINVLLGDMSVIGPRPSPDEENQCCPAWREARLSVKPGITGLWQVHRTRAPDNDFQEWIRHDLEYVDRRSFGLDALILFKTVEDVCRRAAGNVPAFDRHRRAA